MEDQPKITGNPPVIPPAVIPSSAVTTNATDSGQAFNPSRLRKSDPTVNTMYQLKKTDGLVHLGDPQRNANIPFQTNNNNKPKVQSSISRRRPSSAKRAPELSKPSARTEHTATIASEATRAPEMESDQVVRGWWNADEEMADGENVVEAQPERVVDDFPKHRRHLRASGVKDELKLPPVSELTVLENPETSAGGMDEFFDVPLDDRVLESPTNVSGRMREPSKPGRNAKRQKRPSSNRTSNAVRSFLSKSVPSPSQATSMTRDTDETFESIDKWPKSRDGMIITPRSVDVGPKFVTLKERKGRPYWENSRQ
ncbi:unnamed protein product, partial [Notodromas monacha]